MVTKVYVGYEMKDPPLIVNPNDELEGTMIIRNDDKKDKKLKKAFIELYEIYDEKRKKTDPETGEVSEYWQSDVGNSIKTFDISAGEKLKAGEEKKYKFKIKLPTWQRKKGKGKDDDRYGNWRIELHFNQKTKMVASRGSDKRAATCVLPAKGTKQPPSFGDPKKAKHAAKTEAKTIGSAAAPAAGGGDMKFCSSCGKQIKKDAKFCEHCGSPS